MPQLKTTDVVESIISAILETSEVDVVGINEGIFLACSGMIMASEIAKVYIEDICIATLEAPALGKTSAILSASGTKTNLGLCQNSGARRKRFPRY